MEHLGSCGHRMKRGISPAQRFSDAMDAFAKFNEMDYDGDLLLSLEESRSYFTKNGRHHFDEKTLQLDIGKIDTNQDGFISPKEFDEILKDDLVNDLIINQSDEY